MSPEEFTIDDVLRVRPQTCPPVTLNIFSIKSPKQDMGCDLGLFLHKLMERVDELKDTVSRLEEQVKEQQGEINELVRNS